ncbi:MAG: nitrogen fixation protein NifZ [Sulfuritalea sp.]|nr:nitrogen fixation protein NifZ [Sulfuritalea sp.]
MTPTWEYGDAVRVTRNVRNDGTYPGVATGDLLVRRGSVGNVVDVGTFLMDQVIYSVHFLDINRIVGCRAEELIGADEEWVPSRYEVREQVRAAKALSAHAEVLVPVGASGEVLKVLRADESIVYHVHFDCRPGRVFAVPESALAGCNAA